MSEYSDYRYYRSSASNGEYGTAYASRLLSIVSVLPGVRSVCDLGCGNGYLSGLLIKKGFQVTGVDGSHSGVEIARADYGDQGEFLCTRIDSTLPGALNGRRFDAVVSSDVVEHLYRPRDLAECAQALVTPGGWFIVGTPYHGYLKNLALAALGQWDAHHGVDWDGGHIKFFSAKTLSKLIIDAGFEVERFHYFGRVPMIWKNMICVARRET